MLWVILIIALLAVAWGWKYSNYLLPLLIISISLEISRTWFPRIAILEKLGEFVGVIDFGRIFTLAVIAYFIFQIFRPKMEVWFQGNARASLTETIHSNIFLVLGSYIIWGVLSLIWSSDRLQTIVSVARLGLLWLLGIAVYHLVKRRDGLKTVPLAYAAAASFTAVIGVYELISKHYIWLADIYQPINRINATFVDANIYARFLLIGCLATALLMLNATLLGKWLGSLALIFQLAALVGTGSRTAWLALIITALGLVFLVRRRAIVLSVCAVFILTGISILLNHGLFLRVLELRQNFWAALTERQYLIAAGIQMFKKQPLGGVGLGGFQHTMLTTYASMIQNNVSLSHTAVITTAAELGIIGLIILAAFFIIIYGRLFRARQSLRFTYQRFLESQRFYQRYYRLIFAVLAITIIFISAQGEGRFLEDPNFWILTGYLGAVSNLEEVS